MRIHTEPLTITPPCLRGRFYFSNKKKLNSRKQYFNYSKEVILVNYNSKSTLFFNRYRNTPCGVIKNNFSFLSLLFQILFLFLYYSKQLTSFALLQDSLAIIHFILLVWKHTLVSLVYVHI